MIDFLEALKVLNPNFCYTTKKVIRDPLDKGSWYSILEFSKKISLNSNEIDLDGFEFLKDSEVFMRESDIKKYKKLSIGSPHSETGVVILAVTDKIHSSEFRKKVPKSIKFITGEI